MLLEMISTKLHVSSCVTQWHVLCATTWHIQMHVN